MKYMAVVAHLDDELLGFGGSISRLSKEGHEIAVCVLTRKSPTRESELIDIAKKSYKLLGVKQFFIADFECMRLKDEDHYLVVQFIEDCIKKFEPDVIVTHHPSDLHNDHNITSICCQEAARLPQRQIGYTKPLKAFMFMEVKSSTEWALNNAYMRFVPSYYISVSKDDIEKKIEAINMYKDVIRKHPHARSVDALKSLAVVRGSESGSEYAEAFQYVFGVL